MKRTFLLILCLLMAASFCACQNNDTEPVTVPTDTPTKEPTPTPEPTEKPTPEQTEEPTEAPTPEPLTIFGETNGNEYTNADLGLTATFPEGWIIVSGEDTLSLYGLTEDIVRDALADVTPRTSIPLVVSYETQDDARGANLTISVTHAPWDKSTFDISLPIFEQTYQNLFAYAGDVTVSGQADAQIAGKDCWIVDTYVSGDDFILHQQQYMLGVDDYTLTVTLQSYTDENEALDGFVSSITIE